MPMLEKYRHYFKIDPDYFPAALVVQFQCGQLQMSVELLCLGQSGAGSVHPVFGFGLADAAEEKLFCHDAAGNVHDVHCIVVHPVDFACA